jgi:DNA polymerase
MNRHARRHLEMERLFGADFLPLGKRAAAGRPAVEAPRAPEPARAAAAPREKSAPARWPADFEEFRAKVMGCARCGLAPKRTQAVFGVGPPGAPLMFVGEAPGEDEDRQGEPFVGRAGQLLTRTLEKVGVRRDRVYIANILKCRPPGNRTPQFDEMAACMPYLLKQVQYVKPKLLCALGNVACQALLNSKKGITQIRGRVLEVNGLRIFPAFHPAYVLRNMGEKGLFETDIRKACLEAGLL